MASVKKTSYQTSLSFEAKTDDIYTYYIQELIDNHRSIVNISSTGSRSVLDKLNSELVSSLPSLLKPEETVQESRCHTFYRLIGFPVVSKDYRFYNPGFDIIPSSIDTIVRTITLKDKVDIANNPLTGFNQFSLFRENYPKGFTKTFSTNTISASAVCIMSAKIRGFNTMKNIDFEDMDINNQSYIADTITHVGNNTVVEITDLFDENADQPDESAIRKDRYHLLKPFIVDPRIDFSVAPSKNKVAVPFVLDKSNLLVSESTYVTRPILEKIITERLMGNDTSVTLSSSQKRIQDYIVSLSNIKDAVLINQMTSDVYKLSEQLQFAKFLKYIEAIANKLVEAKTTINEVQSKYYWLPIPSTSGPEGGCAVKDIIISDKLVTLQNVGYSLITTSDSKLIEARLRKISDEFTSQTASLDGYGDPGDFTPDPFQTTFNSDTNPGFTGVLKDVDTELTKKRTKDITSANEALKAIEVIMGEFSGFGLCDIIAILGSLYIMPQADLLGFLDEDSYNRMIDRLSLDNNPPDKSNIKVSLDSFLNYVVNFYDLIDKVYLDKSVSNGLA